MRSLGDEGDQCAGGVTECDCELHQADSEAAGRVIAREKARVRARLEAHYRNTVWEKREQPPSQEEWARPLPDYMQQRQEKSYLALQQRTEKTKSVEDEEMLKFLEVSSKVTNSLPSCSIM